MTEAKPRGRAVLPGTFLTTEEEYEQGPNTFEDEKGNIYSACVGVAEFDPENREVHVEKQGHGAQALDVGSTVIAVVTSARAQMVGVEMFRAEKGGKPRTITSKSAFIPVSSISDSYIRDARDEFRKGDIVRARVTKMQKFGIDLTTKGPNLGVIKGFCTRCRSGLGLFGKGLKCQECGSTQARKVAADYGNAPEARETS